VTQHREVTQPRAELPVESPGVDEVSVLPWTSLLRQRFGARRSGDEHRWLVLVVVLVGLFAVSVAITILAVSLVDVAKDVGSTESTLSWAISGPMLAFGVLGPAFGKAGDVVGHKKVFLVGLAGAAVFSALTALAWNAVSLIIFRTLSAGLGSATGPSALALINRVFGGADRVKALGYWSLVGAGAPVIGVVVGGPLVTSVGWRAIFVIEAPLCAAAFLVALALLPETDRGPRASFDIAGAALLGIGTTSLLLGVNQGSEQGWTSPLVIGSFVSAPLLLAAFVAVEHRAEDPLVPFEWFRHRNITAPIANLGLGSFAYMGGFILTPLLLQDGFGYTTSAVALLVVFRPLSFSVTAPLASRATVRVGERWAGVAGAAVICASMLLFAQAGNDTPTIVFALALVLSGIGLGVASPAMTATVANSVAVEDLGIAAAVQQLAMQLGQVVGIQVMQSVQAAMEPSAGVISSFSYAFYVGAVAAGLAVVAGAFVRPSFQAGPVVLAT
jgi:EmrB/QacA subfamily drug resistance transporter